MESKKGLFSHFGGIVRVIILITLVGLIAFFVVRFMRNRDDTKVAQTASQTDKNNQIKSEDKTKESESDDESSASNPGSATNPIPSGIADSDVVPSAGPESIPAVGMTENVLLTAVMLSITVFIYAKYSLKRAELVRLIQA